MGTVVPFRTRVNTEPEPPETAHGGSGGDGPQVVTIRIVLNVGEPVEPERAPERVSKPVRVGGFWTGAVVTLTLMFLGVL